MSDKAHLKMVTDWVAKFIAEKERERMDSLCIAMYDTKGEKYAEECHPLESFASGRVIDLFQNGNTSLQSVRLTNVDGSYIEYTRQ